MNPEMLIPMMLLLPLFSAVATLALPDDRRQVWGWAVGVTTLTFALSVWVLWLAYQPEVAGGPARIESAGYFLSSDGVTWVESFGLRLSFGLDSVSLWLVLLTTFLMPLVMLGSYSAVTTRIKEYYMWLLLLQAAMIGTFIATDVIFFYVCFEFTLVPLYFLIGIWGSKERLRAARVFFLYTFTGSMLTFAGVLYVAYFNTTQAPSDYWGAGTWTFSIPILVEAAQMMSGREQMLVLLALLAGFAVKVPLFPVHTWLPLAHTEAPTAGSVVLAGVLLKLGTYGLLRFAIPMCPQAVVEAAPYIGVLAVIGILYTALICWVQKDIKKLIAYSSVSHLGFCVLGLFALSTTQHIGQSGAVMYMVNHGLSTGALFLCVGMIYERFHTRRMKDYGGFGKVMPVWSSFFVFFCLASVGLPGLNGFVGEILTLMGAFLATDTLGFGFAAAAGVGMIFGAMYILYMVGKVVWGEVRVPGGSDEATKRRSDEGEEGKARRHGGTEARSGGGRKANRFGVADLSRREIATLLPIAVMCLALGLYPSPVLKTLDGPLEEMTSGVKLVLEQRDGGVEVAEETEELPPAGLPPFVPGNLMELGNQE